MRKKGESYFAERILFHFDFLFTNEKYKKKTSQNNLNNKYLIFG